MNQAPGKFGGMGDVWYCSSDSVLKFYLFGTYFFKEETEEITFFLF